MRYRACASTSRARLPRRLGAQVLVNMYNARDFLEGSTYVPWEERKNVRGWPKMPPACGSYLRPFLQAGIAKEGMIEIRRRFGRAKPVVYQVTDKPPPKKSPDWARVAAVLVQGSAWQLKEFPFKARASGEPHSPAHRCLAGRRGGEPGGDVRQHQRLLCALRQRAVARVRKEVERALARAGEEHALRGSGSLGEPVDSPGHTPQLQEELAKLVIDTRSLAATQTCGYTRQSWRPRRPPGWCCNARQPAPAGRLWTSRSSDLNVYLAS